MSAPAFSHTTRHIVTLCSALALLLYGAASVGAAHVKGAARLQPAETLDEPGRAAFLAELAPVTLKNCTLKRFGSVNEGGHLLCGKLHEGGQRGYSYGVGPNDELG